MLLAEALYTQSIRTPGPPRARSPELQTTGVYGRATADGVRRRRLRTEVWAAAGGSLRLSEGDAEGAWSITPVHSSHSTRAASLAHKSTQTRVLSECVCTRARARVFTVDGAPSPRLTPPVNASTHYTHDIIIITITIILYPSPTAFFFSPFFVPARPTVHTTTAIATRRRGLRLGRRRHRRRRRRVSRPRHTRIIRRTRESVI